MNSSTLLSVASYSSLRHLFNKTPIDVRVAEYSRFIVNLMHIVV